MTTVDPSRVSDTAAPVRADTVQPATGRLGAWLTLHQLSLLIVGPLLLVIGLLHAWNMGGWPGPVNGDEGTYVSQAWAVIARGELAPYTYNYDHPPFGWMTIAAYAWLTGGFSPDFDALLVGRAAMLLANLIGCGLIYVLARRLGSNRSFAVVTLLLFALSPIALQYHRMVFLDNLAVVWTLAAMVFAVSPRRSLAAAAGSGLCLMSAILTKETAALFFPFVLWMLVQNSAKRTRIWNIMVLTAITFSGVFFTYIVFAVVKGELFPGAGHVSLLGMAFWQLVGREGTGSLLDPTSATYGLVKTWLDADPWLLIGGAVLIPAGLAVKPLRPIAAALLLQILMMFRGGYVPYPFVIALLPCAALLIGGLASRLWQLRPAWPRRFGRTAVATGLATFIVVATPAWGATAWTSVTTDLSGPHHDATQWIIAHVPMHAVIIVDDYMWTDLTLAGFSNNVLVYKADLDPEVHAELLPNGYASVDYVATGKPAITQELPTVTEAIEHSTVVATFGNDEVVIRQVNKPPA